MSANMDSNKVIFIMGVSGVGKSTIGYLLSEKLSIPFFDGDDYHPQANILKMSNSEPLTNEDRAPWLLRLNELAKKQITTNSCIIGCSALKQVYRDVLSKDIEQQSIWVHLQGTFDQILERVGNRSDHFMPPDLLKSQFDTLQASTVSINIDIKLKPHEIVDLIIGEWRTRSNH